VERDAGHAARDGQVHGEDARDEAVQEARRRGKPVEPPALRVLDRQVAHRVPEHLRAERDGSLPPPPHPPVVAHDQARRRPDGQVTGLEDVLADVRPEHADRTPERVMSRICKRHAVERRHRG
jgi:hypothetical protein